MLNIKKAVDEGRIRHEQDGRMIAYGEVSFYMYDTYGRNDPPEWAQTGEYPHGYWPGRCYNHRTEKKYVEVEIDTLEPNISNNDIVDIEGRGRFQVLRLGGAGDCELQPMDGQELDNLPGVVSNTIHGNIYQLTVSVPPRVVILN